MGIQNRTKVAYFLISFLAIGLYGCATSPNSLDKSIKGGIYGGVAGAGVGAVIGAQAGGHLLEGALLGGTVGAITGVIVGRQFGVLEDLINIEKEINKNQQTTLDKHQSRLDQQEANIHKHQSRLDQQEANIRNLEARLNELKKRMDELANKPPQGILLYTVYFDFDKSNLYPGTQIVLSWIAEAIKKELPQQKFLIVGHSDSIGAKRYNQKISEKRAQSVADFLEKQGIDKKLIKLEAYGNLKPIISNDNIAGRQLNRRVEILILPSPSP